jgi:hypothetical protein
MPAAPAAPCALVVVERTRVTTSTPESPGVPARNGFNGFLRALPGDRALLPPSPTDMFLSKPGWADSNSANLTPASGRQDHTTSPYAATSFVSSPFDRSRAFRQPALQPRCAPDAAASTASHPASVTIMIRPSEGGTAEDVKVIWVKRKTKFFREGGWTGESLICPLRANQPTCPLRQPLAGSCPKLPFNSLRQPSRHAQSGHAGSAKRCRLMTPKPTSGG